MGITQRDDECRGPYTRPTIFTQQDLMAYGANRWRRVEALADEFAKYWKHYMYQIGDTREKWTTPQNNARIGDIVLMRDKNLPRLEWSTGTIINVRPDKEKLVRRVIVQPHKKPGQNSAPSAKERAIHDLVLLKAFTMMVNPPPDTTKIPSAPKEAKLMMTHHRILDNELYVHDPKDQSKFNNIVVLPTKELENPIQQPTPPVGPFTHEESDFLQNTVAALLSKIA